MTRCWKGERLHAVRHAAGQARTDLAEERRCPRVAEKRFSSRRTAFLPPPPIHGNVLGATREPTFNAFSLPLPLTLSLSRQRFYFRSGVYLSFRGLRLRLVSSWNREDRRQRTTTAKGEEARRLSAQLVRTKFGGKDRSRSRNEEMREEAMEKEPVAQTTRRDETRRDETRWGEERREKGTARHGKKWRWDEEKEKGWGWAARMPGMRVRNTRGGWPADPPTFKVRIDAANGTEANRTPSRTEPNQTGPAHTAVPHGISHSLPSLWVCPAALQRPW